MNISINRRRFCCSLVGLVLAPLIPERRAVAKTLPFCRFSLEDGWTDYGPSEYIARKARSNDESGVPQIVEEIKKKLDISVSFDVYITEQENNCFATVAKGRKILAVDVGFLEKVNRVARTEWGAIQVIAHETGHHIAGFSDNRHRNELNADYWSGQALQRLGSEKAAATKAILALGTESDTPSHPNKRLRALTIERGWDDASYGKIDYSFCEDCR